jgi:hypothetical protein
MSKATFALGLEPYIGRSYSAGFNFPACGTIKLFPDTDYAMNGMMSHFKLWLNIYSVPCIVKNFGALTNDLVY